MGIIEAVKKGFALSLKLINVVIIFFIFNAILGLISLPLANPVNAGQPGIMAISLLLSLAFFAIFIFLQAGALGLVRDLHKTGAFSISNFAVYGKKYYVKILGLLAIYILIAVALVLILALLGSGILLVLNNPFTRALVGVIAFAAALAVIVFLLFPIYAIIVDESGVIEALKKGVELGKSNFWKVLGLFAVLVVVSILISLFMGFIAGVITIPLPFNITQIIITIVNSAVQSYIPVVMMIALMGYYLGLKKPAGPSPQA